MNDFPKYSVIIPVYNAQATLRRCVDSLLGQGYDDMEIILVNDGSADDSGRICGEYAQKDSRVVYIDKPNGGVSSARNAGLDCARGRYVLFVDSDDYVSDDYFETLECIDGDGKFDFVMFSNCFVDGKHISNRIIPPFEAMDADGSVNKFCEMFQNKFINVPWNKRCVRRIIEENAIRFPENLYIGEDKVFSLEYAMHCSSCCISDALLYWVDISNENSLSRRIRPDLYEQFDMLTARIYQMIEEADLLPGHKQQYLKAQNLLQLRAVYSEAKRMHIMGKGLKERRTVIRQMCRQLREQNAQLPTDTMSRLLKIPVWLGLITPIDLFGWFLAR